MKKTLLSLGTLSAIVAPVASVIACGDGDVPGHEAPYSITIQADKTITTQANVIIELKGYISDSYLKEIKSRIAEDIARLNKDELKYSTMKLILKDRFISIDFYKTTKLINTSPLTDSNKNDLDAIHNFMDSGFDDLINNEKGEKKTKKYFDKDAWTNQHHQIDKLDQNEVKLKLLKMCGFNSTNPDTIDFKYEIISDKYMSFTITRTNVAASPELVQQVFSSANTGYPPFLEGEKINFNFTFNRKNKYDSKAFNIEDDAYAVWYNSKSLSKNGTMGIGGSIVDATPHVQLYKMAKYLLKANGYSNDINFISDTNNGQVSIDNPVRTLGSSANKVFTYGDNGQIAGINHISSGININQKYQMDFDKKIFKIKYGTTVYAEKQWIFGENGDHLMIQPNQEWNIEFEGTYEVDGTEVQNGSITLTKAIASDGTNTINILESSAKIIVNYLLHDKHWFFNGW